MEFHVVDFEIFIYHVRSFGVLNLENLKCYAEV